AITAPTSGLTDDSFDVTWRVSNDGLAAASGFWTDRIYLSSSNLPGTGTLLGSVDHSGTIDIGEFYEQTRSFTLPSVPGSYWVIVTTNFLNTLSEASVVNNTRVTSTPIDVEPAYRATVETDVEVALNGTPIPLHGHAFSTITGDPVAD